MCKDVLNHMYEEEAEKAVGHFREVFPDGLFLTSVQNVNVDKSGPSKQQQSSLSYGPAWNALDYEKE